MQEIRYLEQEEKSKTRKMYENNFPEDSTVFVDYYYKYKIQNNQILVMENKYIGDEKSYLDNLSRQEETQLQVMLHLNPYTCSFYEQEVELNYIVAVATDASVRRQGKMGQVMERTLCDMALKHQPFTFLIPANPKVYVSKGFSFIETEDYKKIEKQMLEDTQERERLYQNKQQMLEDTQEREVLYQNKQQMLEDTQERERLYQNKQQMLGDTQEREALCRNTEIQSQNMEVAEITYQNTKIPEEDCLNIQVAEIMEKLELKEATYTDIPQMIKFSNNFLAERYHIFPIRTEEFYKRKFEELKSENGGLLLLFRNKELVGVISYGKEEKKVEIQEILVLEEYVEHLQELLTAYFEEFCIKITKMEYMVRILDLNTLVKCMYSDTPFLLKVQVKDAVISQNEGYYEIYVGQTGGNIRSIPKEETVCTMDIAELTKELFRHIKFFVREWV